MERALGDRERGVGEPAGGALKRDQLVWGLVPFHARLAIPAEFVIAAPGKAVGWSGRARSRGSAGGRVIGPGGEGGLHKMASHFPQVL